MQNWVRQLQYSLNCSRAVVVISWSPVGTKWVAGSTKLLMLLHIQDQAMAWSITLFTTYYSKSLKSIYQTIVSLHCKLVIVHLLTGGSRRRRCYSKVFQDTGHVLTGDWTGNGSLYVTRLLAILCHHFVGHRHIDMVLVGHHLGSTGHWHHTHRILIIIIICLAHTDCQLLSLPSTSSTHRAHIWEPLLWRCTSEVNSRIKLCRPVVYFSSSSPTTFPLDGGCRSDAVLSRLSLPCELNELSTLKLSQTTVFVVANKHW